MTGKKNPNQQIIKKTQPKQKNPLRTKLLFSCYKREKNILHVLIEFLLQIKMCPENDWAISDAQEGFFVKGKAFKEEVGEARRELRYGGKDASGAKQMKSCPNAKRPLNIQVQELAALSQGYVLCRMSPTEKSSCGCWCPRLSVPRVCVGTMSWCSAAERGCMWAPALLPFARS